MFQSLLQHAVKKKKILMPLAAVVALSAWFGWYVWHWEHREPLLEVHFFDVTKGSAVFVRTPQGKTALIGGGQGSDIIRKLTDVMPFYRRHIDTVIYPADPANSIGLTDVVGRYDVGEIIRLASSTGNLRLVLDSAKGSQVILESVSAGTTSVSSILRLSHGSNSFLLADILSRKDQQALVDLLGRKNEADILQLRSASQTRVSTFFFDAVHPKYLLVSKMPQRPKPKSEVIKAPPKPKPLPAPKPAKSLKPPKLTKSGKPAKAKAPAPPKPAKPVPVKKPAPPKDPPFDPFAYPKSKLKIKALDWSGTVEFISDGVSIRVLEAKD